MGIRKKELNDREDDYRGWNSYINLVYIEKIIIPQKDGFHLISKYIRSKWFKIAQNGICQPKNGI